MIRNILAIVAAIIVGSLVIFGVEQLGHVFYPPPEGLELTNPEAMEAYMNNAPTGALLLVALAHAIGALVVGVVVTLISRKSERNASLIGGVVLLLFGLINLIMIPHPHWFMWLDLAVYVPFAFIGHRLVYRE